jgi:hypothetical protein
MSVLAPRRIAFVVSTLAGVVTILASAPARAALPLTLTWEAPAGCPTADDVRAELERLVRFPPGHAPPALVAEGYIATREGRWHLRLRTVRDGLPGERELEADTCASLAHAATLVVALAFGVGDSSHEASPPSPPAPEERPARPAPRLRVVEPPPPAAPPPPEPPAPPPPVVPRPERNEKDMLIRAAAPSPSRPPTIWSLAAETRVSAGPLPGVDWGAGIGVDATSGRFVAALRLNTWLPTDDPVAGTTARMRYSGVGVELALCAIALEVRRFTLAGCGIGGVAALRGASSGGLADGAKIAPWYTAGIAFRGRLRVTGAMHLEARVEAPVFSNRLLFAVTDPRDPRGVYTVPWDVIGAVLGLSYDL